MKQLINSWVFGIHCNFFFSLFFLSRYGNSYKVSFTDLGNNCNFTCILSPDKNENRTYGKSMYLWYINNERYDINLNSPENYDTLTADDVVQQQYMTLPYPAVSREELENEKHYYERKNNVQKTPHNFIESLSFEALNYFLYNGRNSFRLEFK